jgi:hypothetical protein
LELFELLLEVGLVLLLERGLVRVVDLERERTGVGGGVS